jgi:hypothetical protein
MPLRPFRKQKTGDRQVDRLQDQIGASVLAARLSPFGSGGSNGPFTLPGPFSTNQLFAFDHGLGYAWTSFIVTSITAEFGFNPTITAVTGNVDPTKQIQLQVSEPCTFTVWVS